MILRRHYIAAFLQSLFILIAFASCIDDDFVDGKASHAKGEKCYLFFQIQSTSDGSQTRAFYEDGNEQEQAIDLSRSFLIFFDGEGKLFNDSIQMFEPLDDEKYQALTPELQEYIEAGYVTEIHSDTTTIDKSKMWPKQCLLVLNGPEDDKFKSKIKSGNLDTKEKILGYIWDWSNDPQQIGRIKDAEGKEYFTMTNTIYVDNDKLCDATEITDAHIQAGKEPVDWQNILRIRVERITARFSFEINNEMIIDGKNNIFNPGERENAAPLVFFSDFDQNDNIIYQKKEWNVKVTGWGINALEKDNHLFKKINDRAEYIESWGNDPAHYRSYWCEDSHYYLDSYQKPWIYPWQYRRAIDKMRGNNELEYYGEKHNAGADGNLLRNYSYNDFVDEDADNFNKYIYTPENTYVPEIYKEKEKLEYLDDRTNLLAGTHLIVCAELQVKDATGDYKSLDVYRDRNGIYYENERQFFTVFVHIFNNLLKSQKTMDFTFYDWAKGGGQGRNDLTAKTSNSVGIYQLYYKNSDNEYKLLNDESIKAMSDEEFSQLIVMSPATIEHGDGKILPWLEDNRLTIRTQEGYTPEIWTRDKIIELNGKKDDEGNELFGYDIEPGERQEKLEKGEDYDNCIKSLLYEWLGAVDHFNNGKMYYAAPVLHNGTSSDAPAEDEKIGDFGVVRNNWYKFNLTGIKNIGTPVDDPAQPIVPERVDNKDVLNIKIEYLPWHEVETVAPIY